MPHQGYGSGFLPGESGGIPNSLWGGLLRRRRPQRPNAGPLPGETPEPPIEPDRIQSLEADMQALDQPMTGKQRLLGGLATGATLGLSGLFGGSEGLAGAVEGVNDVQDGAARNRELRRKSLAEELADERNRQFQTSERMGQEDFRTGERLGGQEYDTEERLGQQEFRTGERVGEQDFRTAERIGEEGFRSGESRLEREAREALQQGQQTFQTGERVDRQEFDSGESRLEREARESLQGNQQSFTAGQNAQDRSLTRDMATAKNAGGPQGGSPYSQERATRTIQSVDELMGKVNRWTTGFGSMLDGIPQSDARNFKAELDTLKANIAFNELTQMREASKTGGALGAVSNIELGLLNSALGALDTGQDPANIKTQLQKIKASVERWQKAQGGQAPGGGISEALIQANIKANPGMSREQVIQELSK